MRRCGYARCEARKSHDLGLQVSCRVDNKVSVSGVGRRCRATGRELLREIARAHEMTIYAGAINRDHVHMLIGIPPHLSVSRAVQYLKGKSSHKLLSEYQSLRKRYWGQHLWGRGYWVATSGNVTDEVWKKYIEDQKPEIPDDNFKVV
jgi:putative transposase